MLKQALLFLLRGRDLNDFMDKKIQVAQIVGKGFNGGVEACIFNYFKAIDKSQVTFDFFVENTSDIINKEVIESMGGRVIITPKYTNLFKYLSFLRKKFKQEKYDIVHSNLNTLSVFPLFAAWLAGIKVRIAHSHSTSNKKEHLRNLIKGILRPFSKVFATHYFACSELAGRWLFGNRTFNKGKVFVLNNAIDIDRFKFNEEKRISTRTKYNIKDDEIVLGNIGRLCSQKNQKFLLDLIEKLDHKYKLIIVGDGELKQDLENSIKEKGIQNRVIMVSKTDKPEDFYNAFDIFLLPSLYEGLPVVGVEAQINGLTCLFSSNITKETKIIENCYFLDNSNLDKWIEYVIEFEKNGVRKSAFENHFQKFDINIQSNSLLEKYERYARND